MVESFVEIAHPASDARTSRRFFCLSAPCWKASAALGRFWLRSCSCFMPDLIGERGILRELL